MIKADKNWPRRKNPKMTFKISGIQLEVKTEKKELFQREVVEADGR